MGAALSFLMSSDVYDKASHGTHLVEHVWLNIFHGQSEGSMMSKKRREARFVTDVETKKRWREIQFIVDIIEPDPEYQPASVSDEAGPLDGLGDDEDTMMQKLTNYFGASFDFDLRQPPWKLVDQLKVAYIEWPDQM